MITCFEMSHIGSLRFPSNTLCLVTYTLSSPPTEQLSEQPTTRLLPAHCFGKYPRYQRTRMGTLNPEKEKNKMSTKNWLLEKDNT